MNEREPGQLRLPMAVRVGLMVKGDARARIGEQSRRDAYQVEELPDAASIRNILATRRSYAAYALGQLDPKLIGLVRSWQAKGTSGQAVVLFSGGGLGDALFAIGETGALEALLRLHRGPRHNYATCQPEHLPVLRRYYGIAHEQPMLRMAVNSANFRPSEPPPDPVVLRRLRAPDVRGLNQLYNTEGAPAYYTAAHLRDGLYFGVFEEQRLVAVAGTHVISEAEAIAVVGNVFTHPQARRHGYARMATGAVTQELLLRCRDVVLTVDPDNEPAVRAYRRLGYQDECRLIEAAVIRKEVLGLASWLARMFARMRGRRQGVELVMS
ncbi:MAG: GNAT family N-acetyltransferase [Dehalococcoidia bacterium]